MKKFQISDVEFFAECLENCPNTSLVENLRKLAALSRIGETVHLYRDFVAQHSFFWDLRDDTGDSRLHGGLIRHIDGDGQAYYRVHT